MPRDLIQRRRILSCDFHSNENVRQNLYASVFEKVREVAGSPNRLMADFEMSLLGVHPAF